MDTHIRIHPTADVDPDVNIGEGTRIWHESQVRSGATIGRNCVLGKGVFIDTHVSIGNNVKIQNYVSVFHGVIVEDGVFIGPHVCFTNDLRPRAVNPDGSLKDGGDWTLLETRVRRGAALGAGAVIRCGITIGEWAMVGLGSVVTHSVPPYALVFGNPARLHGFVCPCGQDLKWACAHDGLVEAVCAGCDRTVEISVESWEKIE